ncbi:ABC transporter ATP-binding protein [Stella sp.]|uniref:ABC transporter ATP-binding protein n=1 Tax=Stella sp. TaxID=2912054 RepID=UPI0035B1937E
MTLPGAAVDGAPLLAVEGLTTLFRTDRGTVGAVDDVSFTLARGRTLAVVGESGCGKSVTALSVMGLLRRPPAEIAGGRIRFEGEDLLALPPERMQDLRGDRLAMIFQEPMTSLNPAFTVGDQIAEAIVRHRGASAAAARERAIELLGRVRIPAPDQRFGEYPHKLSGGMRQRVMIALALACDPDLLIADEPTTALDVTIQAQILALLRGLRRESGMAMLLITHDLGVVAEMADDVIVMYAGRVVERAPVDRLFAVPQHPYTIGLMGSVPRLDDDGGRLAAIEGQVPSPLAPPAGCRFHPRCPFAEAACRAEEPRLTPVATGHDVACRRAPLGIEAAA